MLVELVVSNLVELRQNHVLFGKLLQKREKVVLK